MQENWKRSTGYPPTSCNGRNIKANDIVERAAHIFNAQRAYLARQIRGSG